MASTIQSEDAGLPRLLSLTQVIAAIGASKPAIYKWINDPEIAFPPPIKFGKASRWRSDELRAWIDARTSARRVFGASGAAHRVTAEARP